MKVVIQTDSCTVLHGDASGIGAMLEPGAIDAMVTDPPAGIGFMGKEWDGDRGGRDAWINWLEQTLAPAFVALKPGAHGLVWALPRTSHWTATALENLGFEIRDIHHHLFGTGFPKSLDVRKAIGAKLGNGSPVAAAWHDWGTALKPACEHWILCRKPLAGTVAENVLAHSTGGLNIGATRLPPTTGRWPAHVSFDEEAAAVLDEQSGTLKSGNLSPHHKLSASDNVSMSGPNQARSPRREFGGDAGGASRFFYVAKAPRKEKDAGLKHLAPRTAGKATDCEEGSAGLSNPRAGAGRTGGARNFHPTVKSVDLMRWLVKLITPPAGIVLDPFAGSGSTGVAALGEGFRFIGVERDAAYITILEGRIGHALRRHGP